MDSERSSRPALSDFLTLAEFESAAQQVMAHPVYEYVAGGAGDEISLRANQAAFDSILLWPRVLRKVIPVETSTTLFGKKLPVPILLAPVAYQGLMHPDGELATVRGAATTGVPFVVSTNTTVPIEDLASAAKAPLWFQLYWQRDRGFTQELIQRVEAAGCDALCVTVDTPVLGLRPRQLRAHFRLPPEMKLPHSRRARAASDPGMHSAVTWRDVDWLRSVVKSKLLLKGVLHPADAELAIRAGVDGIVV